MKHEIFALPNLISLSRVLLVILFVLAMLVPDPPARWWGLGILLLAALTDRLDGMLARRMHQETEWGRILDPLADKVGVAAVAVVLLYLRWLPFWFVALLLGRDLLILSGGLLVRRKTGEVLQSNVAGKWAVGVFAATLIFIVAETPAWLVSVGIWTSVTMVAVSTIGYVRRFIEVMRGNAKTT
jgi:CDP-diacylglycerol--glycerol-3-phosphate 3-phosphatidyltransferase